MPYYKIFIVASIVLLCTCGLAVSQNTRGLESLNAANGDSTSNVVAGARVGKRGAGRASSTSGNSSSPADTIKNSSILDVLQITDYSRRSFAWRINPTTFNIEEQVAFDTVLLQPHLFYPYQKELVPQVGLGNLGAPVQSSNFFSRNLMPAFLFARGYEVYQSMSLQRKHYHVRDPHTLIMYATGGKSSQAEQILGVLHTQNVNPHLNVGLEYNFFNTKGMYVSQLTRDNDFSAFASYYKNRAFGQLVLCASTVRNQENGGVSNEYYIVDTVLDAKLVPMRLKNAKVEYKKRSLSLVAGYHIIEKRSTYRTVSNKDSIVRKPILTAKLMVEADKYARKYVDKEKDSSFYTNFYISKSQTNDTSSLIMFNTTALVELSQIAKYPAVPGLRFWISNASGSYSYFEIDDYLHSKAKKRISTNHLGVGVYSFSKYLNYSGALRVYLNGYRAGDREIFGEVAVLPWKSVELPYVKGSVEMKSSEPDIFAQNYFSNHFKWSNNFDKQHVLKMGAEIGAERWRTWLGYNIAHISNYTYFDAKALPAQANGNVTVTSAYLRNDLKLGWFRTINKLLWQNSSHEAVLSLPTLSLFSSMYLQFDVVKNVLTAQVGASMLFNTKYYADGYMPATGQFYNQRQRLIGGYPFGDIFINMKWKTAVVFLKYEHINQGFPNNDFFVAYRYPANQRTFKFGISWMFYN